MQSVLRFAAILSAGILVSASVWFLIELVGLAGQTEMTPFVWLIFYIPIGLIPGSVLIGYLSQHFIRKKKMALLLISPGFYGTLFLVAYTLYGYLRDIYEGAWLVMPLLFCVLWTGSSFVGTLWGFNLSAKKKRPTYSFDLKADTIRKRNS